MGYCIGTINELKGNNSFATNIFNYNKTQLTEYLKGYINRLREERKDTEDLVTYHKREFCINYAKLVIYKLNNMPFDKKGWDIYNEAKNNLVGLGSEPYAAEKVLKEMIGKDRLKEYLDIAEENVKIMS